MAFLRFMPALAFVATFGFFLVDKNREARTLFSSGRGLLVVAVLIATYVVITMAIRRAAGTRAVWVAPVVATVLVLGLAAWTIRPYYEDETVSRRLVADAPPATTPAMAAADPAPTPAAAAAVSGALQGIGHDATGTVRLLPTDSGGHVVRFENFDIEGSPDPQVHLIEGGDVRKPGGTHLGRLAGNRGDVLDYEVPAGVEPGEGWTVLVWCRRFAVPIANATLAS